MIWLPTTVTNVDTFVDVEAYNTQTMPLKVQHDAVYLLNLGNVYRGASCNSLYNITGAAILDDVFLSSLMQLLTCPNLISSAPVNTGTSTIQVLCTDTWCSYGTVNVTLDRFETV